MKWNKTFDKKWNKWNKLNKWNKMQNINRDITMYTNRKFKRAMAFLLCLSLTGMYVSDGSVGRVADCIVKTVAAEDVSSGGTSQVSSETQDTTTGVVSESTTEITSEITTEIKTTLVTASTITSATTSTTGLTTTTQDLSNFSGIVLSATALNIKENMKRKLDITFCSDNINTKTLLWTSSNKKIAKVSKTGVVTALKKGVTTIKVQTEDGLYSANCKVQVEDNLIIVLDPGHGGRESGAVNRYHGLVEQKINLDIAKACRAYLEKYENVTVFMTRTSYKKFVGLVDRTRYAQAAGADVFISMHNNASGFRGVKGCCVFVTRYTGSNKYNKEMKVLGKKIVSQLKSLGIRSQGVLTRRSSYHRFSNGQWADYYSVLRNSTYRNIPSLLIEHAYIDSSDYKFMNSAAKCKKLGQADAKAIVSYYGLKLKARYRTDTEATTEDSATTESDVQNTTENIVTSQTDVTTEALSDATTQEVVEPVTGIKLNVNSTSLTLKKGKSYQLKATIAPSMASNKTVTYSSSNKKIATVSAKGKVKAVKKGSCTITCEAKDGSGVYKTLKVKVVK